MTDPPTIDDATTVAAARAALRDAPDDTVCPCCGQGVRAQTYKRHLYPNMALALIRIYQHFERPGAAPWLHVPTYLARWHAASARGGDYAKLACWGLTAAPDARQAGPGHYRITPLGRAFARGETTVPKFLYMRAGAVLPPPAGAPVERVSIRDVLGEAHDHAALLAQTEPAGVLP